MTIYTLKDADRMVDGFYWHVHGGIRTITQILWIDGVIQRDLMSSLTDGGFRPMDLEEMRANGLPDYPEFWIGPIQQPHWPTKEELELGYYAV